MERRDLSELDRNTLRLWRATNLIGWGAAGLAAFVITYVLLEAGVRAVGASSGGLQLLALPLAAVVLLAPPLVAGIVIGDHVYRWPGWTTIAAAAIPSATIAIVNGVHLALQEALILGAVPAIIALVTARVARVRFESRPRALRSAV
jgi:hypothetical protein